MIFFKVIFGLVALGVIQIRGDVDVIPPKDVSNKKDGAVYEKNLNEVFDKMLPKIRKIIVESGHDPMSIPDVHLTTSSIPGLKGKIHLQRGLVSQASTIKRTGDVIFQYKKKKMTFDLGLGFDELDVTYAYTMRYLLYKRKGSFHGKFKNVKLGILGSYNMEIRKIELKYFDLSHIGRFSLKLEGHLADYLLNALTKIFTTFSRESVIRNIESKFEEVLRAKIEEINNSIPEPTHTKLETNDYE